MGPVKAVACCLICRCQVTVGLTERGKFLPLSLGMVTDANVVVYRDAPRGPLKVRYLRGGQRQLRPGEHYAVAHWDRSPACKPPRKRATEGG